MSSLTGEQTITTLLLHVKKAKSRDVYSAVSALFDLIDMPNQADAHSRRISMSFYLYVTKIESVSDEI